MGLYCSRDKVIARVRGKVRFTTDPVGEPDLMDVKLADDLIAEAEGQLELDLSERYDAPFGGPNGEAFSTLPLHPTATILRNLAELGSSIRILETDFGDGGPVDDSKYSGRLRNRYKAMVEQLLEKRPDHQYMWRYPPLPSLRLSPHQNAIDDGFAGRVLHHTTQTGKGDFPQKQINSPGEQIFGGHLDGPFPHIGRDDD